MSFCKLPGYLFQGPSLEALVNIARLPCGEPELISSALRTVSMLSGYCAAALSNTLLCRLREEFRVLFFLTHLLEGDSYSVGEW